MQRHAYPHCNLQEEDGFPSILQKPSLACRLPMHVHKQRHAMLDMSCREQHGTIDMKLVAARAGCIYGFLYHTNLYCLCLFAILHDYELLRPFTLNTLTRCYAMLSRSQLET